MRTGTEDSSEATAEWNTVASAPRKKAEKKAPPPSLEEITKGRSKVLIVLRGLPGSGKSTLVETLQGAWVASADNFFVNEAGKYVFDGKMIGKAHEWAQSEARKMMEQSLSPVIVDNTNVSSWEAKAYVEFGVSLGYEVEILTPETPWRFDPIELARRNRHGVPETAIRRMLQRWDDNVTLETILAAKSPHGSSSASSSVGTRKTAVKSAAPVFVPSKKVWGKSPASVSHSMTGLATCHSCSALNLLCFRFCQTCATPAPKERSPLLKFCGDCGRENLINFKFCQNCSLRNPLWKESNDEQKLTDMMSNLKAK